VRRRRLKCKALLHACRVYRPTRSGITGTDLHRPAGITDEPARTVVDWLGRLVAAGRVNRLRIAWVDHVARRPRSNNSAGHGGTRDGTDSEAGPHPHPIADDGPAIVHLRSSSAVMSSGSPVADCSDHRPVSLQADQHRAALCPLIRLRHCSTSLSPSGRHESN
jgi:hypothetical protein